MLNFTPSTVGADTFVLLQAMMPLRLLYSFLQKLLQENFVFQMLEVVPDKLFGSKVKVLK